MSDFTVTVELKGRQIDGDEYVRLDVLMRREGFERRVYPQSRFHPPNLITHPDNMPHATYFGRYAKDASMLRNHLESKIMEAIQPDIAVSVAETSDQSAPV